MPAAEATALDVNQRPGQAQLKQFLRIGMCVVGAAVGACAPEPAPQATASASLRDSAGVIIVENPDPAAADIPQWQATIDTSLAIGGGEGAYDFQRVRAVVRLTGGQIVVAEASANELRWFDATGRHIRSTGRTGMGPGEYQDLSRIWSLGRDSLLVFDGGTRRLTVLDSSGTPQVVQSYLTISDLYSAERLSDGRIVLIQDPSFSEPAPSESQYRTHLMLVAPSAVDSTVDTLVRLPGRDMYPVPAREGGQAFMARTALTFGRSTVTAAHGDRILAATNDAFEIREYNGRGALVRIMRAAVPRAAVHDSHRTAYIAQDLARLEQFRPNAPASVREEWKQRIRTQRFASTLPFIDALLPAADGKLWIERYRWQRDAPRRYVVLDSAGRLVAEATLPPRVRPYAIGHDEVLAVWRDPDEIEHVRRYRVSQVGE